MTSGLRMHLTTDLINFYWTALGFEETFLLKVFISQKLFLKTHREHHVRN